MNEKIDELKKKLENRDGLKAAEVKEIVGAVQQQSLKLFEAAYKKMAAQNQQQSSESTSNGQDANKKEESAEGEKKANQ